MIFSAFNYSKGDYPGLCKFLDIDWTGYLSQSTDVEMMWSLFKDYYAALLPRRGPHIASHSVCPSVCLSVCLSVRPVIVDIGNVFSSTASVTDVLFGTHWGPHIVYGHLGRTDSCLINGINQYIPKNSRFYEWRKPSWQCPLSSTVRAKINCKHKLWKQYIETTDVEFLRKYRRIRNDIRKITRLIHKEEQIIEVANLLRQQNSIQKKLWAYIRNKTSLKTTVGDIKTTKTNINGKEIIISDDANKAAAFCQYFSSVFRLDALAKALSVIATATWLGSWLGGCLSQPVLYQND